MLVPYYGMIWDTNQCQRLHPFEPLVYDKDNIPCWVQDVPVNDDIHLTCGEELLLTRKDAVALRLKL